MPQEPAYPDNPLRIASVTPGDGYGRIGITLCPGKTDPAGMSGPHARDLDADLDAIQLWGATAVVSLITDAEFDSLSVRGLPDAARDRHDEELPTIDDPPVKPEALLRGGRGSLDTHVLLSPVTLFWKEVSLILRNS